MMSNFIAKEGLKYIYSAFAVTIFFYLFICNTLAIISFLVTIFLVYIYRNNLITKSSTDSLVSVIDGKIFAMDKTEDTTSIYIEVGVCDSHILVAPKDANYKKISERHGLNLSQFSYKAKELNNKKIISFDDIIVELIAGRCNINHDFIANGEVKQYQKIGMFLNGTVKMVVPNSYKLNLKLSQKIKAGETL